MNRIREEEGEDIRHQESKKKAYEREKEIK